jgi:hypothetical protein
VALCIWSLLATAFAIYRYRRAQPDYKAVARNIERAHCDLKALLLAAIEQEPQEPDGRFGFLQEWVSSPEDREQKTEDRGQRTEDREQKTDLLTSDV